MTSYKIYWSTSRLWYVTEDEDGTVSAHYNKNLKDCNRVPYNNVANAVKSAGGLDAFKARLITPEEAEPRLAAEAVAKAERAAKKAAETAKAEAAATEARLRLAEAEKAGPIAPTESNIRDLLLCVQHSCIWPFNNFPLPQFTVKYATNHYNYKNGKFIAATAVFDTPVLVDGQLTTRVCLGAPRGHLEKYTRL